MPKNSFLLIKKYWKKGILLSVVITYLVIFNILFVLQKTWIGELWISFLPYWLVLNFICLAILLGFVILKVFFRKSKPPELKKNNPGLVVFCSFVIFISCFSNSILTLKVYNYFYQKPQVSITTQVQNGLKIGFFNILESNTQYDKVNTKLKELDLDIISFAEFQQNHFQNIPFLKTYSHSFPKTFPTKKSETVTVAIFSKLPFLEVGYKKLINNNSLLAKVNYNNQIYEVIVSHLSNPYLPSYYEYRNEDIQFLEQLVASKKSSKVLILGDFNTTPWSPNYPEFNDYNNILAGRGLYVTWQVGPFALAIDQMFSSTSLEVLDYKIDTQNGSDHHLVWTEVI